MRSTRSPRSRRQRARTLARTLEQPWAITLRSVALVGLAALLYLGQVSAADAANQRLQMLRQQQVVLARQDSDLHRRLGLARSPSYIDVRARLMGLDPATVPPEFVVLRGAR